MSEIELIPEDLQESSFLDLLVYVADSWNDGIEIKQATYLEIGESHRYEQIWPVLRAKPHALRDQCSSVVAQQALRLLDRLWYEAVISKGKKKQFPQPVAPGAIHPCFVGDWLRYTSTHIYLPKIGRVAYRGILTGKVTKIRIDHRDGIKWIAICTVDENEVQFPVRRCERKTAAVRVPTDLRRIVTKQVAAKLIDGKLLDAARKSHDGLVFLAKAFVTMSEGQRSNIETNERLGEYRRALEDADRIIKQEQDNISTENVVAFQPTRGRTL